MISREQSRIQIKGIRKEENFMCQYTAGYDKSFFGSSNIPLEAILKKIKEAEESMEAGDELQIDFKIKFGYPSKKKS